jgi:hypothetical protein
MSSSDSSRDRSRGQQAPQPASSLQPQIRWEQPQTRSEHPLIRWEMGREISERPRSPRPIAHPSPVASYRPALTTRHEASAMIDRLYQHIIWHILESNRTHRIVQDAIEEVPTPQTRDIVIILEGETSDQANRDHRIRFYNFMTTSLATVLEEADHQIRHRTFQSEHPKRQELLRLVQTKVREQMRVIQTKKEDINRRIRNLESR